MGKEFEIARLTMLGALKAGGISNSRGFAWAHRIHPLESGDLEKTFADDFRISEQTRDEVLQHIDKGYLNHSIITFYNLEERFQGRPNRSDLRAICRVAFLGRRFDERIWIALTSHAPVETNGMTRPFDFEDDIYY